MHITISAERYDVKGHTIRHPKFVFNRVDNAIYLSIQDDKTKRWQTYKIAVKDFQELKILFD